MIKIAIVEDELDMANELIKYTKDFFNKNEIEVNLTHFDNALKLLDNYNYEFDLIFMDINLPKTNGMEAAETIRKIDPLVMIIFVTSLAQYAIKGYEVNAFDFILKPITYYSFVLKLTRALPILKQKNNKTIVISSNSTIKTIEISTIKYIEVFDHKIIFHTTKGKYENFDTLNKYNDLLKNDNFILCNRSCLVNLKYVTEIDNQNVYIDDISLVLSRPRKNDFIHSFNEYLAKGGIL